jgi:hypothetical protein
VVEYHAPMDMTRGTMDTLTREYHPDLDEKQKQNKKPFGNIQSFDPLAHAFLYNVNGGIEVERPPDWMRERVADMAATRGEE